MTQPRNALSEGGELTASRRLPVPAAALVLAGHVPLVAMHLRSLWQNAHYHYVSIVLAGFALLLWSRLKWSPISDREQVRSFSWLLAGLITLTVGTALVSPWLAMLAAILSARGLLYGCLGDPRTRIWLLLWLLLPLPLNSDAKLLFQLQLAATDMASLLLDALGVQHLAAGNVIAVADTEFFASTAARGAQSVLLLIAITAIYVVWQRRQWLHAILLLGSACLWAVMANMLRITLTVVWANILGDAVESAAGWEPAMLRLALVGLAVFMVLSTDQLLAAMLRRRRSAGNEYLYYSHDYRSESPAPQPSSGQPAALGGWGKALVAAFLAVGLLQILLLARSELSGGQPLEIAWEACSAETLPETIGDWKLTSFETMAFQNVARRSAGHVWQFAHASGPQSMRISFETGSPDRLDLPRRYLGRGWRIASPAPGPQPQEGGLAREQSMVHYRLSKATGEQGVLIVAMVNDALHPVGLPAESIGGAITGRAARPGGQLSIFWSGWQSMDAAAIQRLRQLLSRAVVLIQQQMRQSVSSPSES